MHPFIEWQTEENKIKGAKVKRLVKKNSVGKDWKACEVASRILKVPTTLLAHWGCAGQVVKCVIRCGGRQIEREAQSVRELSSTTAWGMA